MPPRQHDDDSRPHWTFDKRINLAHILTTLSLAGALGMYMIRQESRLVVLEEHKQAQAQRDVRQDEDTKAMKQDVALLFREIRDELRALRADINGKK
jgi:hypothetical protein